MSPRELQFLVSLLEDEYETQNHTSFAATVLILTQNIREDTVTNEQLFQTLKHRHGRATGEISRVVSKQSFEYLLQTDARLAQVIHDAAGAYERQPSHLSDDMLVRYMQNQ